MGAPAGGKGEGREDAEIHLKAGSKYTWKFAFSGAGTRREGCSLAGAPGKNEGRTEVPRGQELLPAGEVALLISGSLKLLGRRPLSSKWERLEPGFSCQSFHLDGRFSVQLLNHRPEGGLLKV